VRAPVKRYEICLKNRQGFTLIEILATLVILSVLISTSIHQFDLLSDTADKQILDTGIRELNIRETLIWTQFKISVAGYPGDDIVFTQVDKKLGPGYYWQPTPGIGGGSLHYRSQSIDLLRTPSSNTSAGTWR